MAPALPKRKPASGQEIRLGFRAPDPDRNPTTWGRCGWGTNVLSPLGGSVPQAGLIGQHRRLADHSGGGPIHGRGTSEADGCVVRQHVDPPLAVTGVLRLILRSERLSNPPPGLGAAE